MEGADFSLLLCYPQTLECSQKSLPVQKFLLSECCWSSVSDLGVDFSLWLHLNFPLCKMGTLTSVIGLEFPVCKMPWDSLQVRTRDWQSIISIVFRIHSKSQSPPGRNSQDISNALSNLSSNSFLSAGLYHSCLKQCHVILFLQLIFKIKFEKCFPFTLFPLFSVGPEVVVHLLSCHS